jgi:hypothetical protein
MSSDGIDVVAIVDDSVKQAGWRTLTWSTASRSTQSTNTNIQSTNTNIQSTNTNIQSTNANTQSTKSWSTQLVSSVNEHQYSVSER